MSKQKSSSALVIEKLQNMGYGEVEVEKATTGYVVLCVNGIGEPIIKEFANVGKINSWIETIPDWTVEASEPEMSVEEWEAKYGSVTQEDVDEALAEHDAVFEEMAYGESEPEPDLGPDLPWMAEADIVAKVMTAIESEELIFIEYKDFNGKLTQRIVRPFILFSSRQRVMVPPSSAHGAPCAKRPGRSVWITC